MKPLLHLSAILTILAVGPLSAATMGIVTFEGIVTQNTSFSANLQGIFQEINNPGRNVQGPDLTGHRITGSILINFDLMPAPANLPDNIGNPSFITTILQSASVGLESPEWMTATFLIEAPLPVSFAVQRDQGIPIPPDSTQNLAAFPTAGSQTLERRDRLFDSDTSNPDNPLTPCCESWLARVNNRNHFFSQTVNASWRSSFIIDLTQTLPAMFTGPGLDSPFAWPMTDNPSAQPSFAGVIFRTEVFTALGFDENQVFQVQRQLQTYDINFNLQSLELQIVEDIPEPGSILFLSSGLLFLAYKSRQR